MTKVGRFLLTLFLSISVSLASEFTLGSLNFWSRFGAIGFVLLKIAFPATAAVAFSYLLWRREGREWNMGPAWLVVAIVAGSVAPPVAIAANVFYACAVLHRCI
ncbi:MAG TPA: hypothetical protein VMU01_00510 [Rhizomicrobium sp.]|nr:hypothetical protein [Rhizomicrobium sp.]